MAKSSQEGLNTYCKESERCLFLLLIFSFYDSALQLALRSWKKKRKKLDLDLKSTAWPQCYFFSCSHNTFLIFKESFCSQITWPHSRRGLSLVSATHNFYSFEGKKMPPGSQPASEVRWNLPSLDCNQLCPFVDVTSTICCCHLLIRPLSVIKLSRENKLRPKQHMEVSWQDLAGHLKCFSFFCG